MIPGSCKLLALRSEIVIVLIVGQDEQPMVLGLVVQSKLCGNVKAPLFILRTDDKRRQMSMRPAKVVASTASVMFRKPAPASRGNVIIVQSVREMSPKIGAGEFPSQTVTQIRPVRQDITRKGYCFLS